MADSVVARAVLQRSLRRQRVFVDRMNPLEMLRSESDIRARYRFYSPTIYTILRLIIGSIARVTNRSMALPPLVTLCAALRFFATGSLYMVLGDCISISPASICRSVQIVSEALVAQSEQFIKWPSLEGMDELKQRFYEIAGETLIYKIKLNWSGLC